MLYITLGTYLAFTRSREFICVETTSQVEKGAIIKIMPSVEKRYASPLTVHGCSGRSVLDTARTTTASAHDLKEKLPSGPVQCVSAIFRIAPVQSWTPKITLLRVLPSMEFQGICFDILSDILSGILSDICSSILSNIYCDSLADILSGILSDIL